MTDVTLVEAVNLALARAMANDDNVVVLGQDVGINGGVFRATVNLQERFGEERVIDDDRRRSPCRGSSLARLAVASASAGVVRRRQGQSRLLTLPPLAVKLLEERDAPVTPRARPETVAEL